MYYNYNILNYKINEAKKKQRISQILIYRKVRLLHSLVYLVSQLIKAQSLLYVQ